MNHHVKPMTLIKETDYGTPHPEVTEATKLVTLTIDGLEITVPEGTSIMNAAMQLGIEIPKLCATDSLEPFGSCRLCLCEIEGRKGTPASCTTPVAPGIKVTTQNARLANIRRGVMELYISDHPLDCLTCAANGDCELQDMAGAVGLREVRYGYDGENHVFAKRADGTANDRFKAKDTSNPYFQFEPSKCIVCSRCVRACEEVQGTFALTIDGRGFASHVSASMDEIVPGVRMRVVRRLRAGLSDGDADREVRRRSGPARALDRHDLRLLRRRLLVQGRDAGRRSRRAWCPTRMVAPTRATRASRAASRSAMPRTRIAS